MALSFNLLRVMRNQNAYRNPFSFEQPIPAQATGKQRIRALFSTIYHAFAGEVQGGEYNRWYFIPQQKKFGLLDYCLTLPLEALTFVGVGVAFIGGVFLIPILFIVALVLLSKESDNRRGGFSLGFLEGMSWALIWTTLMDRSSPSNNNSSGGLYTGLFCGALAFFVLYAPRLFVTRAVIPAIAGLLASAATIVFSPIHLLANLYLKTRTPPASTTSSTTADFLHVLALDEKSSLLQQRRVSIPHETPAPPCTTTPNTQRPAPSNDDGLPTYEESEREQLFFSAIS